MDVSVAAGAKTTAAIECRGMTPDEEPAYLQFAREFWGPDSPQADPLFLRWLYRENPNTQGMQRDLLILAEGSRIVGSHHRMRVPWRVNGNRLMVPSLHDLAVLPEYREAGGKQGLVPPGLKIMLAALEKETYIGLFGMTPVADQIYERMHVPEIKLFWLEKIRSRIKAGIQMAASLLDVPIRKAGSVGRSTKSFEDYEIGRIAIPIGEEFEEAVSVKPREQTFPDWDFGAFRWRFFHDFGPRNILLIARKNHVPVGRAVISLGLKKGIFVARVVDLVFQEEQCLPALTTEINQLFSELGAPVCLAVTSSQKVADEFIASGWRYRKESHGSRWFSSRGSERPQEFWISGGAWDFGCDKKIEG